MTVPSTYVPAIISANGVTTAFPFGFLVLDEADLVVELDGLALTIGQYSVSGVGNPAGGTVTTLVAPANGVQVVLRRAMQIKRDVDYQNLGDLLADTLNDDQDAPILMLQQVNEAAGRSLKIPLGSAENTTLPAIEAGRYIRANLAGNGFDYADGTGTAPGTFLQAGAGAVGRSYDAKLADTVSVRDFGAVGDGVTDDTAAFAAAIETERRVFVPGSGTPYRVDNLVIRDGTTLYGEGHASKLAPFTVGAANVLTLGNGAHNVSIHDLTFEVDPSIYPTKKVIGGNGTNIRATLHDLHFVGGGAYAINLASQSQTIIQRVSVDGVGQSGILLFTADQCQIIDCIVQMETGALAGIDIYFGTLCKVSGCNVKRAGVFGYHLVGSSNCTIVNNTSWNTDREGINLQDSNNCLVSGNLVAWDGATSIDFGISVYAQTAAANDNNISGNTIVRPFKSGICIDGSLFSAARSKVSGNLVYGCNIENDANGAGVLLFGAGVVNTHVSDNLIDGTVGSLKYGVNAGGASTLSSITGNRAINAATAVVDQDNGTVALNGEPPLAWVPVVTPGSGAITAYTVNRARYYEMEKMVFVSVDVTITTNGTGATNILITLPFTASASPASMAGRETVIGGFMLSGHIAGSAVSINVAKVDGTYPGGTGNRLVLSGWYERV